MSADPYVQWDAAYVLGSLSPAERHEFELHLRDCQACQGRVAELDGLPGLLSLGRADPAETAQPAVAGAVPLYAGVAAKVARRRRLFMAAAAAALVVVAGSTAAITSAFDGTSAPPSVAVTSPAPDVSLTFAGANAKGLAATGSLTSVPWGTRIDWRCSYAAGTGYGGQAGGDYDLVMVTASGEEAVVASWSATAGSVVTPQATVKTPVAQIARLDIRDSAGATLLSATP